jgi:hypothetical protein
MRQTVLCSLTAVTVLGGLLLGGVGVAAADPEPTTTPSQNQTPPQNQSPSQDHWYDHCVAGTIVCYA